MQKKAYMGPALAGFAAGTVTGLFGAGGGMVLIPALTLLTVLEPGTVFPTSVSVILPICIVSISVTGSLGNTDWTTALPYLCGSGIGGILSGILGKKIPVKWLHRGFGVLILWGGVRYLC